MSFLGRKLHGKFEGEIISDLSGGAGPRIGGARIKHRVKQNWIKMYDKTGLVLRVETVINDPTDAKRDLHRLTTAKRDAAGRTCTAFNPLAEADAKLFQSLMAGEHCLRACGSDVKKQSAKVSRTFRRFHTPMA